MSIFQTIRRTVFPSLALLVGACSSLGSSKGSLDQAEQDVLLVEVPVRANEWTYVFVPYENRMDYPAELGAVFLDIPAFSLAQDTTVTISLGPNDFSENPAGPVIVIGPDDLTFGEPAHLTLPYHEQVDLQPVEALVVEQAGSEQSDILYPSQVEPQVLAVYVPVTGGGRFQPSFATCGPDAMCDPGARCENGFCRALRAAEDCTGSPGGQDVDVDGDAGCADIDCQDDPACADWNEEYCDDGVDNNDNGLVDCEEMWCQMWRFRCLTSSPDAP